jgi:hypothetical protein
MVNMKDIQSIREDLKKQKPADPASNIDKPLSNREAVKQLASTLLKMRKRGFNTGALVELLQKHQITIKGSDLTRYLRAFQGEKTAEGKPSQLESPPTQDSDLLNSGEAHNAPPAG